MCIGKTLRTRRLTRENAIFHVSPLLVGAENSARVDGPERLVNQVSDGL